MGRTEGGEDHHAPVRPTSVPLAVGRRPVTHSLGLENTGVTVEKDGRVRVDEAQWTGVEGLYCLGDASTSGYELTPVAIAAGRFDSVARPALLAPSHRPPSHASSNPTHHEGPPPTFPLRSFPMKRETATPPALLTPIKPQRLAFFHPSHQ